MPRNAVPRTGPPCQSPQRDKGQLSTARLSAGTRIRWQAGHLINLPTPTAKPTRDQRRSAEQGEHFLIQKLKQCSFREQLGIQRDRNATVSIATAG